MAVPVVFVFIVPLVVSFAAVVAAGDTTLIVIVLSVRRQRAVSNRESSHDLSRGDVGIRRKPRGS